MDSHLGKPRGKASEDLGESHRFLHPREGKRDTTATAQEESARACPNSRRGLTPLGRLQKYPKIRYSTEEESSGSGTDFTQGLRPRHRRERNPERPVSNWHGTWPFLRLAELVPEVPVVSREHLRNSRKSRRFSPPGEMRPISNEASRGLSHLTSGTPRVLHTLAATQEVPRHSHLHSRGNTRVLPTSRVAPFHPPS